MLSITDIQPADELLVKMRPGVALTPVMGPSPVFEVPDRAKVIGPSDISLFRAWVIENDPPTRSLVIQGQHCNFAHIPSGTMFKARVPYKSIKYIRRYRPIPVPPPEGEPIGWGVRVLEPVRIPKEALK